MRARRELGKTQVVVLSAVVEWQCWFSLCLYANYYESLIWGPWILAWRHTWAGHKT